MKRYYLRSTSGIANYLCRTIGDYGFYVRHNHSDTSESVYLNINLGNQEAPNTVHVRISNHPAPGHNTDVRYDYDICATHTRQGATTYIKFLSKFAKEHGKELPKGIQVLQPGTYLYKKYAISMQRGSAGRK